MLWFAVAVLTAWMALFPLVADLRVINDDVKFVRGAHNVGTLVENLELAWQKPHSFRPLETIVASACDPVTLICWPVVPVQTVGFLVLAWGVVALCRRALPGHPIAAPLVLLWVLVSPATMSSLWQMDTCSQTWAAALGLWCAILVFDVMRARGEVRFQWGRLALLFALSAIAMTVKETYYGWSASIGIACLVGIAMKWKGDRAAALRGAIAFVAVAVMPLLYLVARKVVTADYVPPLGGDPESGRYEMVFEENIISNVISLTAGMLCDGPLHLLTDDRAPMSLRAIAPLSALVSAGLVFAAAAFVMLRWHLPRSVPLRRPLIAALVCGASVVATVPMGTVSDLYTFGPNVGGGVLIVLAAMQLWNSAELSDHRITRPLTLVASAMLLLIGLYGVASRSYHFALNWEYARTLNALFLKHQATLTPSQVRDSPARIAFTTDCDSGHRYGQVIVEPFISLGVDSVGMWYVLHDPERPIRFVGFDLSMIRPGIDVQVDCASLPVRRHW